MRIRSNTGGKDRERHRVAAGEMMFVDGASCERDSFAQTGFQTPITRVMKMARKRNAVSMAGETLVAVDDLWGRSYPQAGVSGMRHLISGDVPRVGCVFHDP